MKTATRTRSRRLASLTMVGALTLAGAACSDDDGDPNDLDNPVDGVDDVIDDGYDDGNDVVVTTLAPMP